MILDYKWKQRTSEIEISWLKPQGERVIESFPTEMYQWEKRKTKSKHTSKEFKSWDGFPVKKVKTNRFNKFAMRDFLTELEQKRPEMFEWANVKTVYCDIEAVADGEFPDPESVKWPINSLVFVTQDFDIMCLSTKNISKKEQIALQTKTREYFKEQVDDLDKISVSFKAFDSFDNPEREMMAFVLYKIIPKLTVLVGWNFENFDWVYIINRAQKLGLSIERASPTKKTYKSGNTFYPSHVAVIDYMKSYLKNNFSIKVKESNKLDWVAETVLGVKKLTFEGSYFDFWQRDPFNFLLYNIIDTVLVKLIDDKLQSLVPSIVFANISKIRLVDVFSPVALTEFFVNPDLQKIKKNVFFEIDRRDRQDVPLKGGWVKELKMPGKKDYVVIFDFSALYPSIIMQYNLSFDSFLGIYDPETKLITFSKDEKKDKYNPNKHFIANTNDVYTREPGILKIKLKELKVLRKTYQKRMFEMDERIDFLSKELEKRKVA